MPKSKNVKRSLRKKTYVSKGAVPKGQDKIFKSISAYGVNPEPFPRVLMTRVKYSDNIVLTMGVANTAISKVYRGTSIWDPEHAAGGTTVAGHSVLLQIYGRYQVQAIKFTVSFQSPVFNSGRVGYRIRLGGAGPTLNATMENLNAMPLTYISGINTGGPSTKTFNAFIYPWTLHGISKLEYMANSSVYTSAISGNPANADLALIDIFLVDRGNVNVIEVLTKIVYYVKFYDRIELVMSN